MVTEKRCFLSQFLERYFKDSNISDFLSVKKKYDPYASLLPIINARSIITS